MQSPSYNSYRESDAGKSAESEVIRVLIADDHPVVCLGLLGIINGQPDMTVVAQAKSGTEAVALARKHSPDVVLMDLRMPGMNGVEATAAIRSERPESAVIVLTTYHGDEDIRKALAAGQISAEEGRAMELADIAVALYFGGVLRWAGLNLTNKRLGSPFSGVRGAPDGEIRC
jgi:CheY-like chemotaxis protein